MKRSFVEFKVTAPSSITNKVVAVVFEKIHGILNHYEINSIGLSFPEWKQADDGSDTLGHRILAVSHDTNALLDLIECINLEELLDSDLITISPISDVPEYAKEVFFGRDRLHEKKYRYDREFLAKNTVRNPFVALKSTSNGKKFTLRIMKKEAQSYVPGSFNSYGLNNNATVPVF